MTRFFRLSIAATVLQLPFLLPAFAAAQDIRFDTQALSATRWQEQGFGISLLPPKDAKVLENTTDGARITFIHPDSFRISLFIHQNKDAMNLHLAKTQAWEQFLFAFPSSVQIDPPVYLPADQGMDAEKLFLAAKDKQGGTFWYGQVYLTINPRALVVLQLDAQPGATEEGLAVFNAVAQSLQVPSLWDVAAQREPRVKAGDTWRKALTRDQIKAAMPATQLFRIVENGADVGYQRISLVTEPEALADLNKKAGIHADLAVRVESRIIEPVGIYDTHNVYYETGDGTEESWEARTTLRSEKAVAGAQTRTWAEVGVRGPRIFDRRADPQAPRGEAQKFTVNTITVLRFEPVEIALHSNPTQTGGNKARADEMQKKLEWDTPPTAYLSQTDLYTLMHLWPTLGDQTACFYAYDSKTETIALREVTCKPQPNGRFTVTIRPSPSAGPQTYHYNANHLLESIEMADGRKFIATTPEQLKKLWQLR